eukprot:842210-Prymnesium_polylepis.1
MSCFSMCRAPTARCTCPRRRPPRRLGIHHPASAVRPRAAARATAARGTAGPSRSAATRACPTSSRSATCG